MKFLTCNKDDIATVSALTKAEHWIYEDEYRLIDLENGEGVQRYPADLLAGVIFGCQTDSSDREEVRSWLASRPQVKFYEAVTKKANFGLNIRTC